MYSVVTLEPVGIPLRGPRLTYMRTPKTGNRVRCVLNCLGHEHVRIVFTTVVVKFSFIE